MRDCVGFSQIWSHIPYKTRQSMGYAPWGNFCKLSEVEFQSGFSILSKTLFIKNVFDCCIRVTALLGYLDLA